MARRFIGRRIDLEGVAAGGLGRIHGHVGVAEHGIEVIAVAGKALRPQSR